MFLDDVVMNISSLCCCLCAGVCVPVCMCVCVCTCMHVCVRVCVCVCTPRRGMTLKKERYTCLPMSIAFGCSAQWSTKANST